MVILNLSKDNSQEAQNIACKTKYIVVHNVQKFKLLSTRDILITETVTERKINFESMILACNGPL
jgi:hypothetical protein